MYPCTYYLTIKKPLLPATYRAYDLSKIIFTHPKHLFSMERIRACGILHNLAKDGRLSETGTYRLRVRREGTRVFYTFRLVA